MRKMFFIALFFFSIASYGMHAGRGLEFEFPKRVRDCMKVLSSSKESKLHNLDCKKNMIIKDSVSEWVVGRLFVFLVRVKKILDGGEKEACGLDLKKWSNF
ncbi:hypothetical protein ACFLYA_00805 [Candidatus Dependentiae bacterium]